MYEYKVLKLPSAEVLEDTLNEYARDGWRCRFQYVVEGFGGFTTLVVTLERKAGTGGDDGESEYYEDGVGFEDPGDVG